MQSPKNSDIQSPVLRLDQVQALRLGCRSSMVALIACASWVACRPSVPNPPEWFTACVVFGDSLCDEGRTERPRPRPYRRRSDGPVWTARLAQELGVGPTICLACGGATTAEVLRAQVEPWLAANPIVDPGAVMVVCAGGNDLLYAQGHATSGVVDAAVANLTDAIDKLAEAGARTVLVPNLPDLGELPRLRRSGVDVCRAATGLSIAFNRRLASAIDGLRARHPALRVVAFDVFELFGRMLATPAAFGLDDTTGPACAATQPTGRTFLFYDEMHPSGLVHGILGAEALAALRARVPWNARGGR